MLATVLAIGIPALTGLAYLAYEEPAAYARMYPYLIGLGLVCAAGFQVWNFAVLRTAEALRSHVASGKFEENLKQLHFGFDWLATVFGTLFYLTFLWGLPDLLDREKAPQGTHPVSSQSAPKEQLPDQPWITE
jgi:hypothetical protein